jgi:hypothetical protein
MLHQSAQPDPVARPLLWATPQAQEQQKNLISLFYSQIESYV